MLPLKIRIITTIGKFTEYTGRLVSWLTLIMAIVVVIVVIARYFLQAGSIALQVRHLFALYGVYVGPCLYSKA